MCILSLWAPKQSNNDRISKYGFCEYAYSKTNEIAAFCRKYNAKPTTKRCCRIFRVFSWIRSIYYLFCLSKPLILFSISFVVQQNFVFFFRYVWLVVDCKKKLPLIFFLLLSLRYSLFMTSSMILCFIFSARMCCLWWVMGSYDILLFLRSQNVWPIWFETGRLYKYFSSYVYLFIFLLSSVGLSYFRQSNPIELGKRKLLLKTNLFESTWIGIESKAKKHQQQKCVKYHIFGACVRLFRKQR